MKPSIFKKSKNNWPNEEAALANVCEVEGLKPAQLESKHTDQNWVWKTHVIEGKEFPVMIYAKSEEMTEKIATESAMGDLDTFEGNLYPGHTETHFRFTRVR